MVTFKSYPGKRVAGVGGRTLVFPATGQYQTDKYEEVRVLINAMDVTSTGLEEFMARPLAVIYDDNTFGMFLTDGLIKRGYRIIRKKARDVKAPEAGANIVFAKGKERDKIRALYPGVPFFVFDWGYVRRVNERDEHHKGHWQVSRDRLNNVPPGPCPDDRFKALDLPIKTKGGNAKGHVLLIGQMPNDSALNGGNHLAWLTAMAMKYDNVLYRPHPRGGIKLVAGCETQQAGTLQDALDGARLVVTYNSNAGHEALLAGVPVVCDPCAAYAELAGEKIPSVPKRRAFYNRVAYGQWTVYEVQEMLDFVLGGGYGDI